MVTINRDCFARTETVRETADRFSHRSCAWCGAIRRCHTGLHHGDTVPVVRSLYHYGTQSDGGRTDMDRAHAFCSVGCMRSYNG